MTGDQFAVRITDMMQMLYRVSYSQLPNASDREDAVQECLSRAWQNKERLRDERYMQTWVVRILINECHNIRRKNKREVLVDEPQPSAPADSSDHALHDALYALPDKLRLPITLYYIEGFKVREIAKILRLPEGTIKSRMVKGRQELKILLGEEVFAT